MTDIKQILAKYAAQADKRLHELLSNADIPELLRQSMAYSVFAGGKRLRPCMALMANEMGGGDTVECLDIACAIEMIHTYSLIHDDLPAMDDDELRRGKPTNHTVYGEANAILAGDALLSYAFEVMLQNARRFGQHADAHIRAVSAVAAGAGAAGMVAGQSADLTCEGKTCGERELSYIHAHKTGAMITAALLAGLELTDPTDEQRDKLRKYGAETGLCFQIIDDILDETGEQAKMGKTLKKDARSGKLTFVSVYGREEAARMAERCTQNAVTALDMFGSGGEQLCALAQLLLQRNS